VSRQSFLFSFNQAQWWPNVPKYCSRRILQDFDQFPKALIGNWGYLPFTWENRKFQFENQMVRAIPFGKLQKIWAVIWGHAIFLLFQVSLADVDIVYSDSLFRNVAFNCLMLMPEISNRMVFVNAKHPGLWCALKAAIQQVKCTFPNWCLFHAVILPGNYNVMFVLLQLLVSVTNRIDSKKLCWQKAFWTGSIQRSFT